jgi:RNA polymerase primary sigma factor
LGLPKKQLAIIKKAIRVFTANPAEQDEEGWSMDEVFIDERSRPADSHLLESDNRQYVLSLLKNLDEREATVLRLRFGLDSQEPKTLKEIGEHLGLTRERVRQIETDALSKLSQTLQPDL